MTLVTFPAELTQQIVSYLDYISARNLRHVVVTNMEYVKHNSDYVELERVCAERTSTASYVNRNFGDAGRVFAAMSKNYVYLSGSRSLEFFVPGTVDEHSDWDFYIPIRGSYIGDFMCRLEEIGVKWMSYEEEFRWKIRHCASGFTIDREKLAHIVQTVVNVHMALGLDPQAINEMFIDDDDCYEVHVDKNGVHVTPADYMDYPRTSGHSLASGLLTRGSKTTVVQLLGEIRPGGNAYIHSPFYYHSSCVQSFISPYVSCHLYGVSACRSQSYGWRDNVEDDSVVNALSMTPDTEMHTALCYKWDKYAKRGFKYINAPTSYMNLKIRKPNDREAIWVNNDYGVDDSPDVETMYMSSYANMLWHEKPYGLVTLHPPAQVLYGYGDLTLERWITPYRCPRAEEKLRGYLPAGIMYIWRRLRQGQQ